MEIEKKLKFLLVGLEEVRVVQMNDKNENMVDSLQEEYLKMKITEWIIH